MKTNAANTLLKMNSNKMSELNVELVKMGRQLKKLKKSNVGEVRKLIEKVKLNRDTHGKLQSEINVLCQLEQWL